MSSVLSPVSATYTPLGAPAGGGIIRAQQRGYSPRAPPPPSSSCGVRSPSVLKRQRWHFALVYRYKDVKREKLETRVARMVLYDVISETKTAAEDLHLPRVSRCEYPNKRGCRVMIAHPCAGRSSELEN